MRKNIVKIRKSHPLATKGAKYIYECPGCGEVKVRSQKHWVTTNTAYCQKCKTPASEYLEYKYNAPVRYRRLEKI